MHPLLAHQVKECFGKASASPQFTALLEQVDETYSQFDAKEVLSDLKYRGIFENATDGIFQTTNDGHYLSANPALARIYGYASPDELIDTVRDIAHQLYVQPGRRADFIKIMDEQGEVSGFESQVYRKDGSIIWITEACRAVRDESENLLYYVGTVKEITENKLHEAALRDSEERYALAVQGANDGLFDWNLKTGEIYFSPRWKQMLGYGDSDIASRPDEWFTRIHPDDFPAVQTAIAQHWDNTTPLVEVEHRMRHADGSYRWMLSRGIALRDADHPPHRMAGSMTDITKRKDAEEQLLRDAFQDALTHLPNRSLFLDRLERCIARTKRHPTSLFAVLFLDVDRFKLINDSLGHLAGDQLLIAFAHRLTDCLRPCDTVARLGGDEFTVLLDDLGGESEATAIADRILGTVKAPFRVADHDVFVTASIGIAMGGTSDRPQDLLRDADTALYRAKSLGKSRYQIFDAGMHQRAVRLLQLETDLRRAIDNGEFMLHYQPIFHIATGKLHSFEALIRWIHPDRGLIPPGDFIPIAEETGLITVIGRWVLAEACRQLADWQRRFPQNHDVSIAVNLSAKQFNQPGLCEQVRRALDEHGIPPQRLVLEITESVVMENAEHAAAALKRLKSVGVKVHIDDFGTGYSSLAYLHKFPVDTMKIDRSFVSRLDSQPENAEIIRTIVALAHSLKMSVTAEGVETAEQLTQIKNLACENGQGFLLSKPLTAEAAGDLLANAHLARQVA
ncbi:MAG TPA: EAL domain-containing protein [Tepidisphaeraceae bacterium]|nr:EAL domain-containing protein [Tepidisphaeraceae bacterium]